MAKKKNKNTQRIYSILKILVIFGFIGILSTAFVFAERYVKSMHEAKTGKLIFENTPVWVNKHLLNQAYKAVGGDCFRLEQQGLTEAIARRLASVPWLHNTRVQVAKDSIRVNTKWRRPIGVVKSEYVHFYVDEDLVVLDTVSLDLPIVTIKGVQFRRKPASGTVVRTEDLSMAVELLAVLGRMDQKENMSKPLLAEIDRIDVGNFQGRRNAKKPHIVLFAKDQTPIIWGAELRAAGKYLQNSDKTKLANLYTYYRVYGSLMGNAKYIDLRYSQYEVPIPTSVY